MYKEKNSFNERVCSNLETPTNVVRHVQAGTRRALRRIATLPSLRTSVRAKIVLLALEGIGVSEISRSLGVSRNSVYKWISRFQEMGVAGLQDAARSGRPQLYPKDCVRTITKVARSSPNRLGLPFRAWSVRKLEYYLREEKGIGIKRSRIWQILKSEGIELSANRTKGPRRIGR